MQVPQTPIRPLAVRDRTQHAFDVVVAVRGPLPRSGATRRSAHEEHADLLSRPPCQGARHAQSVVAPLCAVGWIVEDEEGLVHG